VDDLRQDAATFVQELDAAQQASAAEQSKHLAEERARLASGTAAFLGDANAAHQAMTAAQRQQLEEYMAGLHRKVDDLRQDAATFIEDLDAAHRAMAAEQQQWLATDRAQLALDVGGLRAGFQAELGAVRADQTDARRVWRNLAVLLQQRQGRRPSPAAGPPPSAAPPPPPPPSPPVEEPGAPPSPVAEAAPDDLTAIRGIGPGMKERLNQAGIYTFAQIAQSTPDALRELLGDAGRLAKVESWIDQVHDMGST
jgi:predicted flap endonuclease-1-like 5' DNA nuclease